MDRLARPNITATTRRTAIPSTRLNYKELLNVCGTATNAFVNLASAGGIEARRLLLLDAQGMNTNHVVAEVHLDGRWVIVDPTFHAILKDSAGRLLTRQELASPAVFQDATRNIPGYDPAYNLRTHRISSFCAPAAGGTFSSNQFEFRSSVVAGAHQLDAPRRAAIQCHAHRWIRAAVLRYLPATIDFLVRTETFHPSDESVGAIDARRSCFIFRSFRRSIGEKPSRCVKSVVAFGGKLAFLS